MKKMFVCILAVAGLFFGTNALAQTSVSLGIAGRGYVNRVDEKETGKDGAAGYVLSVERVARLGKIFGVSAGIDASLFTKKDWMDISGNSFRDVYVDIPLRAKLYLPLGDVLDLSVFAGPVPSYNVSAALKSGDADYESIYDNQKDLRRFNVMFGGGVGLDIIQHVKLAASFDMGLVNTIKTEGMDRYTGVLKLSVGYIF